MNFHILQRGIRASQQLSAPIQAQKQRAESNNGSIESGVYPSLVEPVYNALNQAGSWQDTVFFGTAGVREVASGNVATLFDQSGNDRDATQGTSSNRPSDTTSSDMGGRAVLDYADGDYLTTPTFPEISQPFTVFAFAKNSKNAFDGSAQHVCDSINTKYGIARNRLNAGGNADRDVYLQFDGNSPPPVTEFSIHNDRPTILRFIGDSGTARIFYNSLEAGMLNSDSLGSTGFAGITVGANNSQNKSWQGEYATLLIVKGTLDGQTAKKIENIIRSYYGQFGYWEAAYQFTQGDGGNPLLFHKSEFNDNNYRLLKNGSQGWELYKTPDFSNGSFTFIESIAPLTSGSQFQDHFRRSDGKWVLYESVESTTPNEMRVWTGDTLSNISELGTALAVGDGDSGIYYDEGNGTVHIYAEDDDERDGFGSQAIAHYTTPENDLLNTTSEGTAIDLTDGRLYKGGDAAVIKHDGSYWLFLDNTVEHPYYTTAVWKSPDLFNWTEVSSAIHPDVFGGDLSLTKKGPNTWFGGTEFTKYSGSGTDLGIWEVTFNES